MLGTLALALLLQAAPAECKATTDVPELRQGIKRACAPGLISIDISGDHDTLTETIVLDKDMGGKDLSAVVGDDAQDGTAGMTTATLRGFHAAMESARIMETLYHSERFIWRVRDRADRPICFFEVTDDETTGRCTEKP